MNNKLIAASAAVVALALVFAGIGYATYSATLVDNETVTADNNFITLTLGSSTDLDEEVDFTYDYSIEYNDGTAEDPVYKPYLVMDPTMPIADAKVGKALLGAFQVKADTTYKGAENASTTYKLTIGAVSLASDDKPGSLTGIVVKAYTDSGLTSEATVASLSYDTVYYLGLVYAHDDADNINEAPTETLTISYSLTAEANIVAAS